MNTKKNFTFILNPLFLFLKNSLDFPNPNKKNIAILLPLVRYAYDGIMVVRFGNVEWVAEDPPPKTNTTLGKVFAYL